MTGKTPQQILSLSDAAVAKAHSSFHFIDESRLQSQDTILSGYDTAQGAAQRLTSGAEELSVERTATGVLYVRGTAGALEKALGLPVAVAESETKTWIAVQAADAPYAVVAGALVAKQELGYFRPQSPLHLRGPVSFHGRSVLALSGRAVRAAGGGAGDTATLYVPTKAPYTPVGATLTFGSGSNQGSEAIVFNQWGTSTSPTVPAGAVAFSSVKS